MLVTAMNSSPYGLASGHYILWNNCSTAVEKWEEAQWEKYNWKEMCLYITLESNGWFVVPIEFGFRCPHFFLY